MKEITKFSYKGLSLNLYKTTYPNGRIALRLFTEEGEPYMTATINITDGTVQDKDHTFIKDYSENAGILQALEEQKIVERTGHVFRTNYTVLHLVKVLI